MRAAIGAAGGTDLLAWALDQGGAFIALLITGYGWRVERVRADAERAARDQLVEQFMVRVIPSMEASTAILREFVELSQRPGHRRDD